MSEEHYAYILVEYEPYWKKRIEQRQKGSVTQAFVRRGKAAPENVKTLLFYVTRPVAEVRARADFAERITGKPDELWSLYGSESAFESRDTYDDFVGGRPQVTFIRFQNLEELGKTISWKELSAALNIKRMPIGGRYLSRETLNFLLKREL